MTAAKTTNARGANQSVDTKYATALVCDALEAIKSGRVGAGVYLLNDALSMLPDVGSEIQREAEFDAKSQQKRRGFSA